MRSAYIVTDIGFGDSGKGSIVDYLCEIHRPCCVVRYSGGAQASHTVVRDDLTHRFHTYGSGTLLGIPTTLTPDVLVDPIAIWQETQDLKALGIPNPSALLAIDPECLVVTPYQRALNRLEELARGSNRHGSCGMGIGVTRRMDLNGRYSLRVKDFKTHAYKDKIYEIRNECSIQGTKTLTTVLQLAMANEDIEFADLVRRTTKVFIDLDELQATIDVFPDILGMHPMFHPTLVNSPKPIIFEGSQGLLIDENCGFSPYTTWTDVTSTNARRWAHNLGCNEVKNIGVTRCYMARHGAGPLPSETPVIKRLVTDPNNPKNPWQGEMRFGYLDLPLLHHAMEADPVDEVVVTCLDQLRMHTLPVITERTLPKKIRHYFGDWHAMSVLSETIGSMPTQQETIGVDGDLLDLINSYLGVPVTIASYGPTAADKRRVGSSVVASA